MKHSRTFLELEPEHSQYRTSKFIVVPCPHEVSTCYGKGTKNGPQAILNASYHVENFDEELCVETYKNSGIHTMRPCQLKQLPSVVDGIMKDNKVPIILGGEHSLTPEIVKIAALQHPGISVLQFDAHADLRNHYNGDKKSHACAMMRTIETCPIVQVGIRNLSADEFVYAQRTGQIKRMHYADHTDLADKVVSQLSETVYITFDVDVFDPSVMPSTGTPEPGGLLWYEVLDILRAVAWTKKVVAADFVELMPIKGLAAPDFMVAKLIYRLMGYLSR
jgi:agmatinase